MICSLCNPLAGCLMSNKESVSSGCALCITALIQSTNWQFATEELVNDICLKISGALEEVCCQTIPHLGLVIALSKQKQLRFEYWQPLIRSGLHILDGSTKAQNSEMIISCIEMVHSIIKTLDFGIISYEISNIVEAMEPVRGVCEPEIRSAACQLAEFATNLSNQIFCSPAATANTCKRRRNNGEEITSTHHALFVCSSDKSDWTSFHDYAKDNRDSLIDKVNTPGSTSKDTYSETTCNDLKLISRRSLQLMENLHEAGLTLGGRFSSKNFVIDKYQTVKFDEATAEDVKMIQEEGVEMKEDYHRFVHMMRREIFGSKLTPNDMSTWLYLIDGCDDSIAGLLKHHINMMDEHQSASAFTSMFDMLLEMEETDLYGSYKAAMKELKKKPLYCNWQEFVNYNDGNGYLNQTFRCSVDKKNIIYKNTPMGLLLMLRNSRQHSAKFKESEFARIVAEHFPDLMSDLQLALHRQKKLSKMNLRYSLG